MPQNILVIGVTGAWFVVGGLTGFFNEPGIPPTRLDLFVGFILAYGCILRILSDEMALPAGIGDILVVATALQCTIREKSPKDNYTSICQNEGEIKFIQLENGISLRYLEIGTGRPLILLHTLRTQLDYFEGLLPLIKNRFHIYAIDLPGHGHSSLVQNAAYDELFFRQSIVAFIRKLDLKNAVLAGESIGAVLALTVAAEMPDRVVHVYALNPYDYGEKFGGGIRRSKYGYIIGLFRIFKSHTPEIRSILKLLLSGGFVHTEKLPPHLLSEFNRTGERPGYRHMEYLIFKNWQSWLNAVNLYERVSVPVTLVYGESDWSWPEEREDRKDRLARARMLTLSGVGHFSAIEDPQKIAEILLE